MYRLYIDYGNGYQNEKENTMEDIINRLQHKDYDKYLIIKRENNTDEVVDFDIDLFYQKVNKRRR